MRIRTLLLAGVASGVVLGAGVAGAAEVKPGGALDVTISGQLRSGVIFAEDDEISGSDPGYGFYSNHRFIVSVLGKDDGSLNEYGGRIRFRVDNGRGSDNNIIDKSWLFIRGGWGDFRIGNVEGPADEAKIFSSLSAAGTGGVDGDFNPSGVTYTVPLSGNATKVIYYTPSIAGFQAGVSFAPDGGSNGLTNSIDDSNGDNSQFFEGAANYKGSMSGFDILAGLTGSMATDEVTDDDLWGLSGGVSLGFSGISVSGAYGHNDFDAGGDVDWWNVGVGGSFGPAKLGLEYAASDSDTNDPTAIVASASFGLFPGVSLLADVGLYDEDLPGSDESFGGLVALDIQF